MLFCAQCASNTTFCVLFCVLCDWQAAGYGKVVSHVIIGLKTVKGTKQLKLDPTIYDSLQKERVQVLRSRPYVSQCHTATIGAQCMHSRKQV